jgi:hypothetical protein
MNQGDKFQTKALSTLRDELLPKLMKGELRVNAILLINKHSINHYP